MQPTPGLALGLLVALGFLPHLAASAPSAEPTSTSAASAPLPSESALVPFSDSWLYPQILNFRPADRAAAEVNPPRFSWPWLPDTVAPDTTAIRPTRFTFQLTRDSDFSAPVHDFKKLPWNFHNAVPALEAGTWYWRVGYDFDRDENVDHWSPARRFDIAADTPEWDRTVIDRAAPLLASRSRPRLGPPGGDWTAHAAALRADPVTADYIVRLLRDTDRIMKQAWWNDFPSTDQLGRKPRNREEQTRHARMLKECLVVAYAHRLTGDARYARARDHIVAMARWPRGGLLSPEQLGGYTKLPSQAVEFFAYAYDWYRDELPAAQRDVLKEAIRWRLHDMYFAENAIIWQHGPERMRHYGLAYSAGSHPYQNFAWTVPSILLLAGELDIADRLLPLALNYLTGVTIPEGPEEGYNEGPGYANEKAGTLLDAARVTDLLLPELQLGRNPQLVRLAEWFMFLFPGADPLPWGDSWLKSNRGVGGDNLRSIAFITGHPVAVAAWQSRAPAPVGSYNGGLGARPWIDLAAAATYAKRTSAIKPAPPPASLFLRDAGWAFVHSRPIASQADFNQAIGLQFQMRPRGGYSHSYASDGSFVWFAHGQTLTGGGGWRTYTSEFSQSSLSHNTLLVNGHGQARANPYQPSSPYVARPVAIEQKPGVVYWAADLSRGYDDVPGVARATRHVAFVDNRWFVLFDDLAVTDDAAPATFHWLFHVEPDVPLALASTDNANALPGWDYAIAGVGARVRFAQPADTLNIEHVRGVEAVRNPVTNESVFEADVRATDARRMFKSDTPLGAHALRVSNAAPARAHTFLAVLAAAPPGAEPATIERLGPDAVRITDPDGHARTVSFNLDVPADIVIDVARVRAHTLATRPDIATRAPSTAELPETAD